MIQNDEGEDSYSHLEAIHDDELTFHGPEGCFHSLEHGMTANSRFFPSLKARFWNLPSRGATGSSGPSREQLVSFDLRGATEMAFLHHGLIGWGFWGVWLLEE